MLETRKVDNNKIRKAHFVNIRPKVIHRLEAFSNAICRTFVRHFTRFQL